MHVPPKRRGGCVKPIRFVFLDLNSMEEKSQIISVVYKKREARALCDVGLLFLPPHIQPDESRQTLLAHDFSLGNT